MGDHDGDHDGVVESVGFSRRSFVKKLLAVGFAVPVVSSFALDASADGDVPHGHQDESDFFLANMTSGRGFRPVCTVPHGHDRTCEGFGFLPWTT
ncbi:MAG TPA: hypothetical protein VN793_08545 [Acidimicrobiales bacterium]|nr:hypothetical protein [Acidimicrobiales bacterium]